jgi:O-antigen ligase
VAVNARSEAWQLAWTVWRPRWLVGWGPGTYAEAYALRHPGSIADARFHAHNALIHTGVETGLLGAAAAVGLVLVVLLRAGRNLHAGDPIVRGIRLGLLASLIGVAARFQVDYFDPGSAPERVMVLLSIVAGLAVALGRDDGATAAAARADSSPR